MLAGSARAARREERLAERMTISLPGSLADYVRRRAESTGEAQSAIVADAIRRDARERLEQEMIQGLIEDFELDTTEAARWEAASPPFAE